ncbi:MAG: hypothetical protein PHE93_06555, partial [Clostridia bacterium]|nr:hypothetical protein [Clostridia bacterium]
TQENDHLLAIAKKIMENVDWRHLTTGSSGLTGQARSQLNRMLSTRAMSQSEFSAMICPSCPHFKHGE